jgi:hypothetical protein
VRRSHYHICAVGVANRRSRPWDRLMLRMNRQPLDVRLYESYVVASYLASRTRTYSYLWVLLCVEHVSE